jgi:hypothetical protein
MSVMSVNPEIACVTNPDVVCPARELLVSNYRIDTSDLNEDELAEVLAGQFAYADDEDERTDSRFPFPSDESKLQVKLVEHGYWAERYECDGPQGNVCPPRIAMNNNVPRSIGVSAVRKVLAFFKK